MRKYDQLLKLLILDLFPMKLNKTFTNGRKKADIEEGDLSSVLSLSTASTDKDKEKIYRIFLICWFLHSVYGLISLFVDYTDKDSNPDAYYLVLILTFKWIISAIATFILAFGIYVFCKIFLQDKNFGEYIGAIYMVYSGLCSVMIVLAVPFSLRALYISNNLQFMLFIYIQIEVVLDVITISEVLWTLFFASNSKSKYNLFQNEEEKGIKGILNDKNLERLQKEILGAYQKNEILKFEKTLSNKESSPDLTYSERENQQKDERLSVFPISELEGEQYPSFEQGSSVRKNSRASSKSMNNFPLITRLRMVKLLHVSLKFIHSKFYFY